MVKCVHKLYRTIFTILIQYRGMLFYMDFLLSQQLSDNYMTEIWKKCDIMKIIK